MLLNNDKTIHCMHTLNSVYQVLDSREYEW